MPPINQQSGFFRFIVLIIIIVLVLAYFNVDVRTFVQDHIFTPLKTHFRALEKYTPSTTTPPGVDTEYQA